MRRLISVALAAAALAACSSMEKLNPINWFSSAPSGPKPAELPSLTSPLGVRVMWSSSIGGADEFILSPALYADHIFAASRGGTVSALDATTGQSRWRVSVNARISGGVGTDGTLVAVASDEGEVIVLDAQSGQVRWRSRVSSEVLAAPKVGEISG